MSGCERIRHDLGGYVLGGLEPEEFDAVEEHLAACDRCRNEVAELVDLPGLLDLAHDQPRPAPEDLRRRVLGGASPAREQRFRRRSVLVAAASLLLGVVLGGAATVLWDQPAPADLTLAVEADAPEGPTGEAELRQVDAGVRLDLELAGVRSEDEGYYHAWLHRGDVRVSAGTFVGPADGHVEVQLLCGGRLEDYDRLTVTWHAFGEEEALAVEAGLDPAVSS